MSNHEFKTELHFLQFKYWYKLFRKKIQGMTPVIIKIFITLYKANVSVNVR